MDYAVMKRLSIYIYRPIKNINKLEKPKRRECEQDSQNQARCHA